MSTNTSKPDARAGEGSFGASVYGGRPNFGIIRHVRDNGQHELALYELLPDEQAEARQGRLNRVSKSITVKDYTEVFSETPEEKNHYTWDEWSAVEIAELTGSRLQTVLPIVRDAFKEADIDPSAVATTQTGEVFVPERIGVKLAVAFLGVKDLRRVDRMQALIRGVSRMSTEECLYWYAKCRAPTSPNGVQALRTLLTNHIK